MNHEIASAVSLTNLGADKLATGEYYAAASAFCGAIKIMQALAETADETTCSSSSIDEEFAPDFEAPKPWSYEALPVLSPELIHNEIAVFEHCFAVIPAKGTQAEAYTTQDCELFTAALIYNLALTYHYCGVCGNSNERMTDALNLYEKAASMIGNMDDSHDGHSIYMAVSNNAASLALVLRNLSKYEGFHMCLRRLLREKDDFYASFFGKNISVEAYRGSPIHNIPMQ